MPPGFVEWLPPGLSLEILEHKNLIRISQLLLHLSEGIFVSTAITSRRAVRVDQVGGPPAPRQGATSQRLVIPGTSDCSVKW